VLNRSYDASGRTYTELHHWGSWSLSHNVRPIPGINGAAEGAEAVDLTFSMTNTYNQSLLGATLLPFGAMDCPQRIQRRVSIPAAAHPYQPPRIHTSRRASIFPRNACPTALHPAHPAPSPSHLAPPRTISPPQPAPTQLTPTPAHLHSTSTPHRFVSSLPLQLTSTPPQPPIALLVSVVSTCTLLSAHVWSSIPP